MAAQPSTERKNSSRGGKPPSPRDDAEPDAHTRHDPEARSSREADRLARGPELPLREDEDDDGPPGLDDDAETVEHGDDDFRSADGDEDEDDENYFCSEEFFTATASVPAINAYLKACGTQSTDTPVEMPVASSEAAAKGPSDIPQPTRGG